ncbi:aminodeoxychorismate/anthranilate synthase component II [Caldicellulosiruptoraceae bacterium PP1]
MILIIDNYDSFTYNLVNLIASKTEVNVVRNDKISLDEIDRDKISGIVISPGPGKPKDAGITMEVINAFTGKIPILGVCLGHQAIVESFGGKIKIAERIYHGRRSIVNLTEDGERSTIFKNIPKTFIAGRYHSLIADEKTPLGKLKIAAKTKNNEIMAVVNDYLRIYGLQFHPESILTPDGSKIINNFLNICFERGFQNAKLS